MALAYLVDRILFPVSGLS